VSRPGQAESELIRGPTATWTPDPRFSPTPTHPSQVTPTATSTRSPFFEPAPDIDPGILLIETPTITPLPFVPKRQPIGSGGG